MSGPATVAELTDRLKAEATALGFDLVGVAPAVTPPGYPNFLDWLAIAGHAGHGLHRASTPRPARTPTRSSPGVRSIVMVGFVYGRTSPTGPSVPARAGSPATPGAGTITSSSGSGSTGSCDWLVAEAPRHRRPGRVADTAPLLERDFARLAGLGWIGKNTMLIDRRLGSYTLLGALLTDVDLRPDAPHLHGPLRDLHPLPRRLPDRRLRRPLSARRPERASATGRSSTAARSPTPMADRLDGWVFGCDVCQEVCPWNRKAPPGREEELAPSDAFEDPDLVDWLRMPPDAFDAMLRGTALKRSKRAGLLRNASLILGTRREPSAVDALTGSLDDPDPVVRDAASWASSGSASR